MEQEQNCWTDPDYKARFGFQGMERGHMAEESGNSYSKMFRQYDVRLGRWMSPDPIFQPWQSPYNGFDGNPVSLTDRLGLNPDENVIRLATPLEPGEYGKTASATVAAPATPDNTSKQMVIDFEGMKQHALEMSVGNTQLSNESNTGELGTESDPLLTWVQERLLEDPMAQIEIRDENDNVIGYFKPWRTNTDSDRSVAETTSDILNIVNPIAGIAIVVLEHVSDYNEISKALSKGLVTVTNSGGIARAIPIQHIQGGRLGRGDLANRANSALSNAKWVNRIRWLKNTGTALGFIGIAADGILKSTDEDGLTLEEGAFLAGDLLVLGATTVFLTGGVGLVVSFGWVAFKEYWAWEKEQERIRQEIIRDHFGGDENAYNKAVIEQLNQIHNNVQNFYMTKPLDTFTPSLNIGN